MKLLHLYTYVYWGEDKEPLFSLYTNTQLNWSRYICTGADVTNDGTEHKGIKKSAHMQLTCQDTCNQSIIKATNKRRHITHLCDPTADTYHSAVLDESK